MVITTKEAATTGRVFDFFADTFSYPNELVWEYLFDEQTGKSSIQKRNPPPSYAHHCFVVVRAARQFFFHAVFPPENPPLTLEEFGERVRNVMSRSPRQPCASENKIEIPGFGNLRAFSEKHPDVLRQNCGGAWQSYAQRGNWRMVLPFTRRHQRALALSLRQQISEGSLPILHVVTFPRLTINHAVMAFGCRTEGQVLLFKCYDPNICERPITVAWDPSRLRFLFPRTHYFLGGAVNLYEIYRGAFL